MNTTIFEIKEHVAYIKLNRPESMNALNPELRYALSQHFDEVEKNKDIWLAVISGEGDKAFCAGMDLKHRALLASASNEEVTKWAQLKKIPFP